MLYLALYTDAGGPISFTVAADSIREALALVASENQAHYDNQADELDLPEDADEEQITAALERFGWEATRCGSTSDHLWSLYEQAEASP